MLLKEEHQEQLLLLRHAPLFGKTWRITDEDSQCCVFCYLHIKAEVHDVAIVDHILFAF